MDIKNTSKCPQLLMLQKTFQLRPQNVTNLCISYKAAWQLSNAISLENFEKTQSLRYIAYLDFECLLQTECQRCLQGLYKINPKKSSRGG